MEELLKNPFYQKNHIPILSCLVGTLLLVALAIFRIDELLYLGLLYVLLALLTNIIYAVYILFISFQKKISSKETISRLGIAILNIPITILYLYIVFNIIL